MARLIHAVGALAGIWLMLAGCSSQDNKLQFWALPVADPPGLLHNDVQAIHQSLNGVLWFATGGGVSRFDPKSGTWQSFTTDDGLVRNNVQHIHQSPDGSLWFATTGGFSGGVSLFLFTGNDPSQFGAAVSLQTVPDTSTTFAMTDQIITRTRPKGLLFVTSTDQGTKIKPLAIQEPIWALAAGPGESAWVGERLGGLHLRRADGLDLHLTKAHGLPSMNVRALARVDQEGQTIWAGTAGGAAQVTLADNQLQIKRTATYKDGLPAGPVAALAARKDGIVFLAYNALDAKWFSNADFAQRRASSRVYFVPAEGKVGNPMLLQRDEGSARVEIRALALSGNTLWAGTSAGLFKAERATEPGAQLTLVTTPNSPQVPIRQLKAHPTTGDLWLIADAQEDVTARLIGYDPHRDLSTTLGPDQGMVTGLPLHDIDFNDDGELVVLTGAILLKVFFRVGGPRIPPWVWAASAIFAVSLLGIWFGVFRHPLVLELRAQPGNLQQKPLPEIAIALKRLQWAQSLKEWRQRSGLTNRRLNLLKTLTTRDDLPAIASLLGMENAEQAYVTKPRAGLSVMLMQLDYPEAFQDQPIPLIGIDANIISTDDEPACRMALQQFLDEVELRFELPFLMLCRNTDMGRHLVPDSRFALIIDEPMLCELLFAPQPSQTLAGLLLTRGLLALSPYSPEGEVRNPIMFYGRDCVLNEVMQASVPQFLLVGPRRVGKSSLLRRVQDELPKRRPALRVVYLDLLGIARPEQIAPILARRLRREISENGNTGDGIDIIDALLRAHFTDPEQPGLILIDEADALVETDAAAGFPLLQRWRSLQADGVCSFILTGYWFLYRRTLDHSSPVYNFATVRELRSLATKSARVLASEPLARLGITYADDMLPARIVERTGRYPSLIQFLCDQLLKQLEQNGMLHITPEHLSQVEHSQAMHNHLINFFRMNTGIVSQLAVYCVLEAESFSQSDMHAHLEHRASKTVPLWVVDQILLQLTLYGLVTKTADDYRWTIPLVHDILLADREREYRIDRLLQELPDDFAAWITPAES